MNILKEADRIVNERSLEKEREYGDFKTSMDRTWNIAKLMIGERWKDDETSKAFIYLIALKLSRLSHAYKEDSMLDLVAYIWGWNNYLSEDNK